jgi:hypothetical protein
MCKIFLKKLTIILLLKNAVDVSGVSRHAGEHDQPVGGQGEEKRLGRRVCTQIIS